MELEDLLKKLKGVYLHNALLQLFGTHFLFGRAFSPEGPKEPESDFLLKL